jgi:hypothetical protein
MTYSACELRSPLLAATLEVMHALARVRTAISPSQRIPAGVLHT